jgi:hypothetical protein
MEAGTKDISTWVPKTPPRCKQESELLFAPLGEEGGVYPVIKAKSFGRKMLAMLGEVVLSPTAWRRRRRVSRVDLPSW